jgi:two-component system, OmpR family, sensor histidine kinase VanS
VRRQPGPSVRLQLTLSYAGFLMLTGFLMLVAAWLAGQPGRSFDVLLRYVPDGLISVLGGLVPGNRAYLLRAYAPAAAIVLALLLVFGLLGGWILAGRMLAPLSRITDATRLAAQGSLSHRIQLPGRRDEFRELADAFDTMLERFDAHFAEQRRLATNASHELRTPLAITQTMLDVARHDPGRDVGDLVDRLQVINTRAIGLTEALLALSRADQRAFAREHVDLSLIAEEATETLLPLAEARGLSIETTGDVAPAIGSPALLLQMTTNLVHNAIVHNLRERGAVWVTTSLGPGTATLTVENTGEILAPESVSTLVEPFRRGAERIRTDHAGVGLGLAIVRSIATAHDGTLVLTPRPGGGLRVTVQLPAAPPTDTSVENQSRAGGGASCDRGRTGAETAAPGR